MYSWDGNPTSKMSKVNESNLKIELPRDTILVVEFVMEFRGEVTVSHLKISFQFNYTDVPYMYVNCKHICILRAKDSDARRLFTLWMVCFYVAKIFETYIFANG